MVDHTDVTIRLYVVGKSSEVRVVLHVTRICDISFGARLARAERNYYFVLRFVAFTFNVYREGYA